MDDVNEFIPLWSEQEYNGQLEEGDLSSFILQVKRIAGTQKYLSLNIRVHRSRPLTMTARPTTAMSASIPFPVPRPRRCSQWISRASSPTPSPCGPGGQRLTLCIQLYCLDIKVNYKQSLNSNIGKSKLLILSSSTFEFE